MTRDSFIAGPDDLIRVTGAAGFVGLGVGRVGPGRVLGTVRCRVRPAGGTTALDEVAASYGARVEVQRGNLLSREDCLAATAGAVAVVHLAAARGEKSFPDAFMNSVVTTRNLLDGCVHQGCLRRFVNVRSFAVYSNVGKLRGRLLDESCPIDARPALRGHAYTFAKAWQDEIVREYGRAFDLPFVIVRPGYVYGVGNEAITNRVGIGTFGIFLHLGGGNTIPLTYVDNCADAIALAAVTSGIDGHVFNIVDDDLPTSRAFLRQYKRSVKRFRSIYLPHALSYLLCSLWERYSTASDGQLPPVYNRRAWHAFWKRTRYSNQKAKMLLGWTPRVATADGLTIYFRSCAEKGRNA